MNGDELLYIYSTELLKCNTVMLNASEFWFEKTKEIHPSNYLSNNVGFIEIGWKLPVQQGSYKCL